MASRKKLNSSGKRTFAMNSGCATIFYVSNYKKIFLMDNILATMFESIISNSDIIVTLLILPKLQMQKIFEAFVLVLVSGLCFMKYSIL